jgi:hypothetical protein
MKAISWSSLKNIARSPLHYQYALTHKEHKTAYIEGGAIHCLVLEPEEFDARYALCEVKRDKRHKAYQEWLAEHDGKEPLTAKEWDHVHGAAEAVMGHRVARDIFYGGRKEEPLEWVDPDTGLKCRGRLDYITPSYVAELKSAQDPDPRAFTRDCARYMYHGQLSLYHSGAEVLRKIDGKTTPYIVAVAKDPPYDVACYQVKPGDLSAGRELVLSLMRLLETCIKTDMWPGVAPDLLYLDLPPWAPGLRNESEEW